MRILEIQVHQEILVLREILAAQDLVEHWAVQVVPLQLQLQ
jgi:hypothetical protein